MNGGGAWLLAIARDGGRNNNSNVKVCTGKEEGASMVVCGARKWTAGGWTGVNGGGAWLLARVKGDEVGRVAVHECEGAIKRRCFISVCEERRNE